MLVYATCLLLVVPVVAWPRILSFDDCYDIYNVNERKTYRMTWHGETVTHPCRVSFHGYDSFNPLKKYDVCIIASTWTIDGPGLEVVYYSGNKISRESEAKRYSLKHVPAAKWCSEPDHYVDVLLVKSGNMWTNQSEIILEITAKISHTQDFSMSWVGSLLGVVVILSLVTITTFTLRRRMCVLKKQYNQEMETTNRNIQDLGSVELSIIRPPPYTEAPPPPYHSVVNSNV